MTYTVCIVQTLPCLHLWSEKQTSTTLHCSKLTFESSVVNSLNKKTYLQAVSQKRQTVLATVELNHFIETVFVQASIVGYSPRFRKRSSVKCTCTQSNIWVELFWNSVVNKINHWFLVESSFGSPNKVVSLTQQNSVSEFWSRMIEFIPIIFIYNL